MRRIIAIAVAGMISCAASSAYAQCASCAAPSYTPHVHSVPVYSAPMYPARITQAPIMSGYGSPCATGRCGHPGHAGGLGHFGMGLHSGGGCVGAGCAGRVHSHMNGTVNRLWDLEQRKNRWLLTHIGIR